jgi:hypothetical protein
MLLLQASWGAIGEIKERSSLFQECLFDFEERTSNLEANNLAIFTSWFVDGRHLWLPGWEEIAASTMFHSLCCTNHHIDKKKYGFHQLVV